jgi:hypothetical protein
MFVIAAALGLDIGLRWDPVEGLNTGSLFGWYGRQVFLVVVRMVPY